MVVFGILARLVLVSVGGADQGDDAIVTASRRPFSCSWKCADVTPPRMEKTRVEMTLAC